MDIKLSLQSPYIVLPTAGIYNKLVLLWYSLGMCVYHRNYTNFVQLVDLYMCYPPHVSLHFTENKQINSK